MEEKESEKRRKDREFLKRKTQNVIEKIKEKRRKKIERRSDPKSK